MFKSVQKLVVLCSAPVLFFNCATFQPAKYEYEPVAGPQVQREFRAAWVATVANINWPSEPGLPTEQQKAEVIVILDRLQELNFNAVVFQVRPQCDALYASDLEPWSYYLSGVQGQAPEPYYDPLEFWIEEAHKRGLELHAWLNPYRAHHIRGGPVSEQSIIKQKPELCLQLSTGYWWLDPSQAGTQEHSLAVVMDIVLRYNVDGIHFDDYFYPYPSYNGNADFPDSTNWAEYQSGGGKLSRDDWRRDGVNRFIQRLYTELKKTKPHVKFGLSPFGIWRPNYPTSIRGFDQYAQLYADARLWLRKGWIDYWTPQLYWPVNQVPQSYPVLLGWWDDENQHKRHLWPGISIGRRGDTGADESVNQIMITRGMLPDSPGNVHWSFGPLITNQSLASALIKGPYKRPALVPPSPWLDKIPPASPLVKADIQQDQLVINWSHPAPEDVFRWVLAYQYGNHWDYSILNQPGTTNNLPLYTLRAIDPGELSESGSLPIPEMINQLNEVRLSAIDRVGNESGYTVVPIPPHNIIDSLSAEDILERYSVEHPAFAIAGESRRLDQLYDNYRLYQKPLRKLKYAAVDSLLHLLRMQYPEQFHFQQVGESVEKRPINLVKIGSGEIKVLLWSQMHGDEPTATAALFDMFNYLCSTADQDPAKSILENLTILAIPMLNPDGAERFTRRNTIGIDVNRDARDLQSPEGQVLFSLKEDYSPDFGFNLHDMSTRETVGESDQLVALALMAPPFNAKNDDNLVRTRAKKLAVVIMDALNPYLEGHIAKYDADYMPRAFGDSMQNWGVSTVLIESAGWFGEADAFLQKTNFIAFLVALQAIATGDYTTADPERYDQLPVNGRDLYDLLIRDVSVVNGTGAPVFKADLGINFENGVGRIADLGDLNVFAAKDTIIGENLFLTPGLIGIVETDALSLPELVDRSDELLGQGFTTLIYALPAAGNSRTKLEQALIESGFIGNRETAIEVKRKLTTANAVLSLLKQLEGSIGVLMENNALDSTEFKQYSNLPLVSTNGMPTIDRLAVLDEAAVKKLTGDRADLWGLTERGKIRSGRIADLVLFDNDPEGSLRVVAVYLSGKQVWPAEK